MADEFVTVRWAGEVVRARVVRRYKNGRVSVAVREGRYVGGRPGSSTGTAGPTVVTVEPWQIIEDEVTP